MCHSCQHKNSWPFECRTCPSNTADKITFHKLNGLRPTIDSCTKKVIEEVGELMQILGKERGASGEEIKEDDLKLAVNTALETLDTAQAAVTMFLVLCEEYGLPVGQLIYTHQKKLADKKYLVME